MLQKNNSDNETNGRFHSTPFLTNQTSDFRSPTSLPTLNEHGSSILQAKLDINQVQMSLSILQLDPADRAVIQVADRRDAIQKKAFTNWVNHHLSKRNCWVQDLFVDLRTGYLLVRLLESLTDKVLGLEYIESRVHWMQNVQRVLDFLRYRGVRIVNIRADEIVDGNPKLTLGLIWIIILHFQFNEVLQLQHAVGTTFTMDTPVDELARHSLLNWCRTVTSGYPGVFVRDFADSWRDGRAFLALIHRYNPHLLDYTIVDRQDAVRNAELAFTLAERNFHVSRLLDAEDLTTSIDERSLMTYIASLFEALTADTPTIPPMPALHQSTRADLAKSGPIDPTLKLRWTEYRSLATDLIQWIRSTSDRMAARNFPPDLESLQRRVLDPIRQHRLEELPRRDRERQQLVRMYAELKPSINSGRLPPDPCVGIDQINRLWADYTRALQDRETAARTEQRRLDRLQWTGDQVAKECKAVDAQLIALERHTQQQFKAIAHTPLVSDLVDRWTEQLGLIEVKLNGLFSRVQQLRAGRYVHTERIYRDVCTLHQRFLELQRCIRNQKHANGLNGSQPERLTTIEPQISSTTKASPPSVTAANQTNGAIFRTFPAGLSTRQSHEFDTPIQQCLARIEEQHRLVVCTNYGNTWRAVEEASKQQEQTHREVVNFRRQIDRLRMNQPGASNCSRVELQASRESLRIADQEYERLLDASTARCKFSQSLVKFVRQCEDELSWLREQESIEFDRDWSNPGHMQSAQLQDHIQNLTRDLQLREVKFSELSVIGSTMQLEGHPASDFVQSYLDRVERHRGWLLQLIVCSEARLEQLRSHERLESDRGQCEQVVHEISDQLTQHFSPNQKVASVANAERLKKQLQQLRHQLTTQEDLVIKLVNRSQDIVPFTLEQPDTSNSSIGLKVQALCCFRSSECWPEPRTAIVAAVASATTDDGDEVYWPVGEEPASFDKGDLLTLVGTPSQERFCDIRTPSGNCLHTPLTCFLPTWTCPKTTQRMKQLNSLLNQVKSNAFQVSLWLENQSLRLAMEDWISTSQVGSSTDRLESARQLYVDSLRHVLALRLANRPTSEVDQFERKLAAFESKLQALDGTLDSTLPQDPVMEERVQGLRQQLTTLASQLQRHGASALPAREAELGRQIEQHKLWAQDLSRLQSQCEQLVSETSPHGSTRSTPKSAIQLEALRAAADRLHLAGQGRGELLAETDAWQARLASVNQSLTESELTLLGSALRNHGLLPLDTSLEPATTNGLRSAAVERAHKDLKSVADQLPWMHTELELLHQQLPSSSGGTRQTDADSLELVSTVSQDRLEKCWNTTQHRLTSAMSEVEQELKSFSDSRQHFSTYKILSEQLANDLPPFARRVAGMTELARSIGLESGPDKALIQAALIQANELTNDVEEQISHVGSLNHHTSQLVFTLTTYARLTQSYRQLVETTFQKSGGLRDYRWSPGFGLFDLAQILVSVDEITDAYNHQAQRAYEDISHLYQLIRNSGYTGELNLSTVPQSLRYQQIYPNEWPHQLPMRQRPDRHQLPDTNTVASVIGGSQGNSGTCTPILRRRNPSPSHAGAPGRSWALRLGGIGWEPVVLVPHGWVADRDHPPVPIDRQFLPLWLKPIASSGAWFITRLTGTAPSSSTTDGEPLCVGDAIRANLIDLDKRTCLQASTTSDKMREETWNDALQLGWITAHTVRTLSKPTRIAGMERELTNWFLPPNRYGPEAVGVDPSTGQWVPDGRQLSELTEQGQLTRADSAHLAATLCSGIWVEHRDAVVTWCEANGPVDQTNQQGSGSIRPCLSDWLQAGAYNPATGRLRVSLLLSPPPPTSHSTQSESSDSGRKLFTEQEMTLKEAIDVGLLDPKIPEIVVPMDNGADQLAYRRISLAMAASLGIVDLIKGLWCGISQWASVSVRLDMAQVAGLISRAPTLSEALLSGLLIGPSDGDDGTTEGLLDAHTGEYIHLNEAVQRGLLLGSRLALVIRQNGKVSNLSVGEALNLGILNDAGQVVAVKNRASPMSIWDAVNAGVIRLIHTEVHPPPVGILVSESERVKTYYQHPIVQAIRTNLLDPSSEEILLSPAEAKQHGLTPKQRRVPLRQAAKLGNLCDSQTVQLLTQTAGLAYPDGRELNGLEALARGWMKPSGSNQQLETSSYGEVIDPSTDLSITVGAGTKLSMTRPLSCTGARLLLGLSALRPERGFLVTQRLICRLNWLGPGLQQTETLDRDVSVNGGLTGEAWTPTKPTHNLRTENIVTVLDPVSGRRLVPEEAISRRLLDLNSGIYCHPISGQPIPLSDAIRDGFVFMKETGSSSTDPLSVPEFSCKETRTYHILSVMNPSTGQLVSPDQAVEDGLIDLEARMYTGTSSDIPLHDAIQRGLVLAHGVPHSSSNHPKGENGSIRSSGYSYELGHPSVDLKVPYKQSPPLTLTEVVAIGRIVQHPDKRCLVHVAKQARFVTIEEAVRTGCLDAKRSLIKVSNTTDEWVNLTDAMSRDLVDGDSGFVNLQPGWISVLEAAARGLLSDVPSSTERPLSRDLVATSSSELFEPCATANSDVETDWLEPSNADQSTKIQNGISAHQLGDSTPTTAPKKRGTLTKMPSLRRLFSPHSTSRLSVQSDSHTEGTSTLPRNGHEETRQSRATRLFQRFTNFRTLSRSNSISSRGASLERPRRKPPTQPPRVELQERNCVLYALYYLHDEVRVEAAITDTMVREGRVDIRRGLVCNPTTGRLEPASEALTTGFALGIIFTRAERLPHNEDMTANDQLPETVFWLEVFHHRHEIYQLQRVYDPYEKRLIPVEEALINGILNPIQCTYTHPVTGELYSIEDALYCGWIQALPVANPPPFELRGCSFDHVHVRTVEEGFTFTAVRRILPGFVPTQAVTPKIRESVATETRGPSEPAVPTTMNLKRHLPGQPTPQVRHCPIKGDKQPPVYLRKGYELTKDGQIEDQMTGERYSVSEAIVLNYATPATETDRLLPRPTDGGRVAQPELEALIAQLLVDLHSESEWLGQLEDILINMGSVSLNDRSNQRLLDTHQDMLDQIHQRQAATRSLIFQAEQVIGSNRESLPRTPETEQLRLLSSKLRQRLDRVQRETESRVRSLTACVSGLEQLTDNLRRVSSVLDRVGHATGLVMSSNSPQKSPPKVVNEDLTSLCDSLHTALGEAQGARLDMRNVDPILRQFSNNLNGYAQNKAAFRALLQGGKPTSLSEKVTISDADRSIDKTVTSAVSEANDRLVNLEAHVHDRLEAARLAQQQYDQFSRELRLVEKTLDGIGKQLQANDSHNLPKLSGPDGRWTAAQRNGMQSRLQDMLDNITKLQGVGQTIQAMKAMTTEELLPQLARSGLTQTIQNSLVSDPLESTAKRHREMSDRMERQAAELMRQLSSGQSVSELLTATKDCLTEATKTIEAPPSESLQSDSTELHQTTARLAVQREAIAVARERGKSILDEAEKSPGTVSATDVEEAKLCQTQLNELEKRMDSLDEKAQTRTDEVHCTQALLDKCYRESKDIGAWLDNASFALNSMSGSRSTEKQMREGLANIQAQLMQRQVKLDELSQQLKSLSGVAPEADTDPLRQTVAELSTRMTQLQSNMDSIEKQLDLRESRYAPYAHARQEIESWLTAAESRLDTMMPPALQLTEVQNQLTEVDSFLNEWKLKNDEVGDLRRLGLAYDAVVKSHTSDKEPSNVTFSMDDLRDRYMQLGARLAERQTELQRTAREVGALEQLQNELQVWLGKRVQTLVGQSKKLTSMQSIHGAIKEVQKIHEDITLGMNRLDELRSRTTAVLQNREHAHGAAELQQAVSATEKHWSTALNVATERQRRLEQFVKEATEFGRLGNKLTHQLRQLAVTVRALPAVEQLQSESALSHLKQIQSLRDELESMEPSSTRLHALGKRLTEQLQPPVVAELQVGQTIQTVSAAIEQIQANINTKAGQYEALLGPRFQYDQLLDQVNAMVTKASSQVRDPTLTEVDGQLPPIDGQLEQARSALKRANELSQQLCASTTDPAAQLTLKSKLSQAEKRLREVENQLNRPLLSASRQSEPRDPIVDHTNELTDWLAATSDKLEKTNDFVVRTTAGVYSLDPTQLAAQTDALKTIEQELIRKHDALQRLHVQQQPLDSPDKLAVNQALRDAKDQMNLITAALKSKQEQLTNLATDTPLPSISLGRIEAWIESTSAELSQPIRPHGAFLNDPGQLALSGTRLSAIEKECEAKLKELATLEGKQTHNHPSNTRFKDLRARIEGLSGETTQRLEQVANLIQAQQVAQQAVQNYCMTADEAETQWLGLQQDRPSSSLVTSEDPSRPNSTTSSPRQAELQTLQAQLLVLLDETYTSHGPQDPANDSVNAVQAMGQLDTVLKAAGDTDPNRSMAELSRELNAAWKRVEEILQSVSHDLGGSAGLGINSPITLTKQLNSLTRQVRAAQDRMTALPTQSPGMDPETVSERVKSLEEARDDLTGCKQSICTLRNQLQAQAAGTTPSPGIAELLNRLEKLDKRTDQLSTESDEATSQLKARLPLTEQLGTLRNQLASSIAQARASCLSNEKSPSGRDAASELAEANKLAQEMRQRLHALRTLGRHLSDSDPDELTQHQIEAELADAEAQVAQLSQQLISRAGKGQMATAPAQLEQVKAGLERAKQVLDDLRNNFQGQLSKASSDAGVDQTSIRAGLRLLGSRAGSQYNSLEHLNAILDSIREDSNPDTRKNKQALSRQLDDLRGAFVELANEVQVQVKRSTDADQSQAQLLGKIQDSITWSTEKRKLLDEPVQGGLSDEGKTVAGSQLVGDVRAQLKQTRTSSVECDPQLIIHLRSNMPPTMAMSVQTFESWLVTCAESVRVKCTLTIDDAHVNRARLHGFQALVREVDSRRHEVDDLRMEGDRMIAAKLVSDSDLVRSRLVSMQEAYMDLHTDAHQRQSALETALPITQKLSAGLASLSLRLPTAENRLQGAVHGTEPVNLRRMTIDQLETECGSVLAPQVKLIRTSWDRLQELPMATCIFATPTTSGVDGVDPPMSHANRIQGELDRFDRYVEELSRVAKQLNSTRWQTKSLLTTLDGESEWLNAALKRLDPTSAASAPQLTGDPEKEEQRFANLSTVPTDEHVLFEQFPPLAVLPGQYDQLICARDRMRQFQQAWAKRHLERTNKLVTQAHGLLQACGMRLGVETAEVSVSSGADKLSRQLVLSVDAVTKRAVQLDTRVSQVDVRLEEAIPLAKSVFDDIGELTDWLRTTEARMEELGSVPSFGSRLEIPTQPADGMDGERELHRQLKLLDNQLDSHKTILDRVLRTCGPLLELLAPDAQTTLRQEVGRVTNRFRELHKLIKVKLVNVETGLKQSDEIAEQLITISDMFAGVVQEASNFGISVSPTSQLVREPPVDSSDGRLQTQDLIPPATVTVEPGSTRLHPLTSLQPEFLKEQMDEMATLMDRLNQRLPELSALTGCVRAQLEPKMIAKSTPRQGPDTTGLLNMVDPFVEDSVLRNSQKLQVEWVGLHNQLESHMKSLSALHRTAGEQFWPLVADVQNTLTQCGEQLRAISSGCSPDDPEVRRDPMDPSSYEVQRHDLGRLLAMIEKQSSQLVALRQLGDQLIRMVSDPEADHFRLRRDEEQAIRNEVDQALRDLEAMHKDLSTNAQRLSKHIEEQEVAAKQFQTGLTAFTEWISQQEVKWDQFDPVSNDGAIVLQQLDEIISWNDILLNKHTELEALNWSAGQLTTMDTDMITAESGMTVSTLPSPLQSELAGANRRWDALLDSGNHRRHRLQTVLVGLGEFDRALDALIRWITQAQCNIDQIPVRRGNIRALEADLARMKVIQNSVNNHQLAVVRLQEQAKKHVDKSDERNLTTPSSLTATDKVLTTRDRLNLLTNIWDQLKGSAREKQQLLEEALRETFNFHGQFDRLVRRCRQFEHRMPTTGSRILGCLPDSARDQLRRFMEVFDGLQEIGQEVSELRSQSAALLVSGSTSIAGPKPPEKLTSALDRFTDHHSQLMRRAVKIRDQLQTSLTEVEQFHAELATMIQWLTWTERQLAQQKPVSRIVARLSQLIVEHTELRKTITTQREALVYLDRMGTQVQCNAQKQDVVLVRNLLSSVHNRWEQLLSRSAERTRQLNTGLKESQTFLTNWTTLTDWLKEQLICLEEQSDSAATRPERVAHQLAQHHEFQRALGARNVAYDAIRRFARHMRDRAPACDHGELDDMISELKHLWHAVCSRSLNRQRSLEQALLSAGFYKEAAQSLNEWLARIEPQLAEHLVGNCGDVETVEQLVEAHQGMMQELGQRAQGLEALREAAQQLVAKATVADGASIQNQLELLNTSWERVNGLAERRSESLDGALQSAVKFQEMCRGLMDYFAGAEHVIRRLAALPTFDDDANISEATNALDNGVTVGNKRASHSRTGTTDDSSGEPPQSLSSVIEAHRMTHANLMDQAGRVEATLQLGNQLLAQAHPEAIPHLRQWIYTIQSRWSGLTTWSEQRGDRLREALDEQQRRRVLHTELLDWIGETMTQLDREPTVTFADPAAPRSPAPSIVIDREHTPADGEDSSAMSVEEPTDVVIPFCTLPLSEITDPDQIERLLAEHAELKKEVTSRQVAMNMVLKHAKRRSVGKVPTRLPLVNRRGARGSSRTGVIGRPPTGKYGSQSMDHTETTTSSLYVSPAANHLQQRWAQLNRAMDARKLKLKDRLAYMREVEKMKNFEFEQWRQRYVSWLNVNKARVIDLFHRKDLDRDGRLTYTEFIDGILEMRFQTTRVELQAVAEIFDANGDGYIDYRECLNALRAGYVSSRLALGSGASLLSVSQIGLTDEEAINDEVRRQVGLCTCHNTYQICKMTTDKYRFGESQKQRLVRILRSAVMVRVGGGWICLDEFLVKNDPCRVSDLRSSIDASRTTASRSKPSSSTTSSMTSGIMTSKPPSVKSTTEQHRQSTTSLPGFVRRRASNPSNDNNNYDTQSLSGLQGATISAADSTDPEIPSKSRAMSRESLASGLSESSQARMKSKLPISTIALQPNTRLIDSATEPPQTDPQPVVDSSTSKSNQSRNTSLPSTPKPRRTNSTSRPAIRSSLPSPKLTSPSTRRPTKPK